MRWSAPVALVLVACSPYGADDRPGSEAGATPADAGDGAVDAAPSPDGAPPPPFESCATTNDPQRVFCSDFEGPGADTSPFGWTDTYAPSSGSTELAPGAGKGGSRGLRIALASEQVSGRARWLRYDLVGRQNGSHVEMSFDFKLENGELDYHAIGAIFFNNTANTVATVGIATYGRGKQLDGLAPAASPTIESNVVGSYHHAVIRLDRAGALGRYTRVITIDDVMVDTTQNVDLLAATFGDIRVGVFFTSENQAAASVVFDNVVVRAF